MTPPTTSSTSPNRSASTRSAEGSHLAIDADNSVLGEAAARGEPIAIPDLDATADHPLRDVAVTAGFHSVLVVPLVDQKGILGSLVVLRRNAGEFSQNLIGLMKTFAHQSVLAMRNARLFTEVDHKSRELETAHNHGAPAGRQAAGADRPAQGLEQVAGRAGRDATRRNRAHPPPRTFSGAASGATDCVLRRPRRPARQPPPRSHRRVLRSARLYGLYRAAPSRKRR